MKRAVDRRDFLEHAVGFAAAVGLAAVPLGAAEPKKPLFLISLAQWSLHRAFFGKKLDPLDFARIARKDYDIDAIEYVNQFVRRVAA
jgi:L-ribulose-5-phosphate 3-epimerase